MVGVGDGSVGFEGESPRCEGPGFRRASACWRLLVVAAAAVTVRAGDDNDKAAPGQRRPGGAEGVCPARGVVAWGRAGRAGRGRGFWRESADWAWKLTSDSAGLEITIKTGKYLKAGVLRPGKASGTFTFAATLADGTSRTFTGKAVGERKRLVLIADAKGPAGGVRRVSIDPLHDTRVLVLLEAQDPERQTFSRLGEVGYTREGVVIAAGDGYPVCIVTEGRGTMQVSYKGKTYWFCCTGCRDLFKEHPERILAEAAAREKAAAKK